MLVAAAFVVAGLGTARADSLTEQPSLPAKVSLTKRLESNLTELSLDLNTHLAALSSNLIQMRFDATQKVARLNLGGGNTDSFALRLDSDIKFRSGYARIKTRIDLSINGEAINLELPEFDMVPRTWDGQRYVELRLPILTGRF